MYLPAFTGRRPSRSPSIPYASTTIGTPAPMPNSSNLIFGLPATRPGATPSTSCASQLTHRLLEPREVEIGYFDAVLSVLWRHVTPSPSYDIYRQNYPGRSSSCQWAAIPLSFSLPFHLYLHLHPRTTPAAPRDPRKSSNLIFELPATSCSTPSSLPYYNSLVPCHAEHQSGYIDAVLSAPPPHCQRA